LDEFFINDTSLETPITHPEEMRIGFNLQIGKNINIKGNAGSRQPASSRSG
jgi:hypothetical protein